VEHRAIVLAPQAPIRPARRGAAEADALLRAHDIRGIATCLALVADELSAGKGRSAVLGDRVRRACERLLDLGGIATPRPAGTSCGLTALLDDVATLGRSFAGPRTRIDVSAPDLPLLPSAETALFRILLNLVSNAVRATNQAGGGTVRVGVGMKGGEAVIEVVNLGAGLFARSAEAASFGRRTGLGLVIAEALAQDLGGRIGQRRSRDGATVLRLVLPAAVFDSRA
jgi:signal transduction histidine kinase